MLPHHGGLCPQTMSQNKPFFPLVLCVGHYVTAMGTVANTERAKGHQMRRGIECPAPHCPVYIYVVGSPQKLCWL